MPAGRPEKYKKEYCQTVIDLGKQGKTQVQMACALDVMVSTFQYWSERHPEFLVALSKAKAESEAWWSQKALEKATVGGPGSDAMMKFFMAARFGWSDRVEVKTDVTSNGQTLSAIPVIASTDDQEINTAD